MLTVCFDGAGKESSQHKVLVVAGFASFAGIWSEFETLWQNRLEQDDLPYFHAGEFAHSTGVFKQGWKDNERRRRSLTSDLFSLIESCGLRKFGCILRMDDYQQVRQKYVDKGHPSIDAFAFAAVHAVDDFHAYARGEGVPDNNVKFVFEKGDPEDHLRKILRDRNYGDPYFAWKTLHIDGKGVKHDPFIGLQAAGWLAYEFYLDADRLLYSDPTERWALQRFQTLRGDLKLQHRGQLLPAMPDKQKIFNSIRTSIDRLEKAKKDQGTGHMAK